MSSICSLMKFRLDNLDVCATATDVSLFLGVEEIGAGGDGTSGTPYIHFLPHSSTPGSLSAHVTIDASHAPTIADCNGQLLYNRPVLVNLVSDNEDDAGSSMMSAPLINLSFPPNPPKPSDKITCLKDVAERLATSQAEKKEESADNSGTKTNVMDANNNDLSDDCVKKDKTDSEKDATLEKKKSISPILPPSKARLPPNPILAQFVTPKLPAHWDVSSKSHTQSESKTDLTAGGGQMMNVEKADVRKKEQPKPQTSASEDLAQKLNEKKRSRKKSKEHKKSQDTETTKTLSEQLLEMGTALKQLELGDSNQPTDDHTTSNGAAGHSKSPARKVYYQDLMSKENTSPAAVSKGKKKSRGRRRPQSTALYDLVDIGAILTHKKLKADVAGILHRAQNSGVCAVLTLGMDVQSTEQAFYLAKAYPGYVYYLTGIHPHNAKGWDESQVHWIEYFARQPECVGIGECGLDYIRNFSPREDQLYAFERQVALACLLQKPLVLHERSAHRDLLNVLGPHGNRLPPVVMHCFTGTYTEAIRYLALGYYIGITGSLWKDQTDCGLRRLLIEDELPLDRMLVESDSPYMYPNIVGANLPPNTLGVFTESSIKALDGGCTTQRNEPCSLPCVTEMIAACMGRQPAEVAAAATANAVKLFRLPDIVA